jgi:hypothetical protein
MTEQLGFRLAAFPLCHQMLRVGVCRKVKVGGSVGTGGWKGSCVLYCPRRQGTNTARSYYVDVAPMLSAVKEGLDMMNYPRHVQDHVPRPYRTM